MSNILMCHMSLGNCDGASVCHEGYPGDFNGPYTDRSGKSYLCSAWNDEHKVCNLTLQPTVIVNVQESSRHNCNCESD